MVVDVDARARERGVALQDLGARAPWQELRIALDAIDQVEKHLTGARDDPNVDEFDCLVGKAVPVIADVLGLEGIGQFEWSRDRLRIAAGVHRQFERLANVAQFGMTLDHQITGFGRIAIVDE